MIAFGAVSAQGAGQRAVSAGSAGEAARSLIAHDAALEGAGLARPYCARAKLPNDVDRATALLRLAARELSDTLERHAVSAPGRTLVIVGTSSGGMQSLEQAVALRAASAPIPAEIARGVPYFGPLVALDILGEHRTIQVLAACASSTLAIGIGCGWLQAGYADLVIAGGYDAVSDFVAAGFEALGATSTSPRPFRVERDGLALGEGAALLALARQDAFTQAPTLGFVVGFGATSDARHVTAPDPEGRGLARAAQTALRQAGDPPFQLVSAHATGTAHNDAAEARAIAELASGTRWCTPSRPSSVTRWVRRARSKRCPRWTPWGAACCQRRWAMANRCRSCRRGSWRTRRRGHRRWRSSFRRPSAGRTPPSCSAAAHPEGTPRRRRSPCTRTIPSSCGRRIFTHSSIAWSSPGIACFVSIH